MSPMVAAVVCRLFLLICFRGRNLEAKSRLLVMSKTRSGVLRRWERVVDDGSREKQDGEADLERLQLRRRFVGVSFWSLPWLSHTAHVTRLDLGSNMPCMNRSRILFSDQINFSFLKKNCLAVKSYNGHTCRCHVTCSAA